MTIFRPLPSSATVNAVRWGPGNDDRLRALGWLDANDIRISSRDDDLHLIVPDQANKLPLPDGWWVVRREPGDFVTMSDPEFRRTYEAVPGA